MLSRDCLYMLYRDHTVSLCGTHTVGGRGGAGGRRSRGYSGVTGSYQIHTDIPDIAPPQLRGDVLKHDASGCTIGCQSGLHRTTVAAADFDSGTAVR